MDDGTAKIIITTETYREYHEDYRQGGWVNSTKTVYKCSRCKKYLNSSSPKFCEHCGRRFRGKEDRR